MATAAFIVAAAVAAVAAGASAYMQSQQQQAAARAQRNQARFQEESEKQQAEAARKQVRLRAQRFLNAQAAKAGAAGVVAGEGSLLVNQLEAASLAQYEEDLAAFGHELQSTTRGFEARLFKAQERSIRSNRGISTGLAFTGSAVQSFASFSRGTPSGTTLATQFQGSGDLF